MCFSAKSIEVENAEKSILAVAIISCLLGLAEILFNMHVYQIYKFYNVGYPVGVFSNINHQASLLALSLPLAVFYTHDFEKNRRRRDMSITTFGLFGVIVLTLGLFLSQSVAGYFLLMLSMTLSVYYMNSSAKHSKLLLLPVIVLVCGLILNAFIFDSQFQAAIDKFALESATGRSQVFETSVNTARSFGFFGAGPGSFDTVYRLFENEDTLSSVFVNQAHNEYLQLWIEFGILGLIWVICGLVWFIRHALLLARPKSKLSKQKKARIYALCIFLVLIHSLADYPLRTMAIGTIFAFLVIRLDQISLSNS